MNFEDMFTKKELSIFKKTYILCGIDFQWEHGSSSAYEIGKISFDDTYTCSKEQYLSPRNRSNFNYAYEYMSPIATWNGQFYSFTKEFIEWIGQSNEWKKFNPWWPSVFILKEVIFLVWVRWNTKKVIYNNYPKDLIKKAYPIYYIDVGINDDGFGDNFGDNYILTKKFLDLIEKENEGVNWT